MAIHYVEPLRNAAQRSAAGLDALARKELGAPPQLRTARGFYHRPCVLILGARGIPAAHGGFETFAEKFALYMVDRGWNITVYCQREADDEHRDGEIEIDHWRGVRRITITVPDAGPFSTILFDWRSMRHARKERGVPLVLGYNTACFLPLLRAQGRPVVTNMDGVEWKRAKWSGPVKAWFLLNEFIACAFSTELIADHPEIQAHLARRFVGDKVTMIPYGAERIADADQGLLAPHGLAPDKFVVSIARIEPENSVLEMVRAFSRRRRPFEFVCLGNLDPSNAYHRKVRYAASEQVRFPGAIYDKPTVAAMRRHALAYLHGHTVGGTNPSLVEALGAGSAVIAHRNKYNVWTAGEEQFFFSSEDECDALYDHVAYDPNSVAQARQAAVRQHQTLFTWDRVLLYYEAVCARTLQVGKALAALAIVALAALMTLAPAPARADYLLGPGDKLEIQVSAAYKHRATVNADGQIVMPRIGNIKLVGLTLPAAEQRLQEAYRAKNILESAEVLLEVYEYRPFFMDGDVAKPGSYPYQPSITVRQAITLAGGLDMVRFRFGENPFVRAADLRAEYETLAVDRLKLELRRKRVMAELNNERDVDLNDVGGVLLPPATIKEIAQLERDQFLQHRLAFEKETATLRKAAKEAQDNLDGLGAESRSENEAARQEERNAAATRANVDRGVSPAIRLAEVQRDLASAKSRALSTEAQIAAARRILSEAQLQLGRAEENRRTALLTEAQETAMALEKVSASVKASAEKFAVIGGARSALYTRPGEEADVTIYRRHDQRNEKIAATPETEIVAGDVVEINLRPQRLLGLTNDGRPPLTR